MAFWLLLAGLGFNLGGSLMAAVADAWLSRSILVYLDAVEANLTEAVGALRAGATQLTVTGIDARRDRGQDRARAAKTLGWLALALGFGLQLIAAWLTKPSL